MGGTSTRLPRDRRAACPPVCRAPRSGKVQRWRYPAPPHPTSRCPAHRRASPSPRHRRCRGSRGGPGCRSRRPQSSPSPEGPTSPSPIPRAPRRRTSRSSPSRRSHRERTPAPRRRDGRVRATSAENGRKERNKGAAGSVPTGRKASAAV